MNKEAMSNALDALGALAEMSLVFYRAAMGAGASPKEAKNMLESYMRVTIYGCPGKGEPEE